MLSGSQKAVGKITDRQAFGEGARSAARLQIIPLVEILLERRVRMLPWAEFVELPSDFFSPAPGRMRELRKVRRRLHRLYGAKR